MKILKYTLIVLFFSVLAAALQYFNDANDDKNNCNLKGKVVKVTDGDTITVLDVDKVQYKVRLSGIDTPERRQPYGKAAKQFLSQRVFAKTVCVGWYKRDRYQRLIGVIRVDDKDVNVQLVQAGLAWHYKYYASEQSESDRVLYAQAQEVAEKNRIGLWQETAPIAPWRWRKGER